MAAAVYLVNRKQGNLLLALLITGVLAVPIPFFLLLGYATPLAFLLFALQVWACNRGCCEAAVDGPEGAGRSRFAYPRPGGRG